MKKLLLLLTAIIFLASCSNEQKAKKAIKEYLSQNMNDYKSYEPIEFDKIDSVFNNRYENMYNAEEVLVDSLTYQKKVYEYRFSDVDSLEKYTNLLKTATEKLESGTKDYKRTLIGFQQYHKFRAKNSFGGTVVQVGLFTFDSDLNKVINYEQNN